ncbi:MAG: flavin reductase family protein [Elusimicrobia bacterium]|nr:flavin reductase family protein [Elusimicrobiota bacterium]
MKRGEINVAPIAWGTPVNDEPPLVAICVATSHHTAKLINKYGCFAINLVSRQLIPAIKICGSVSGRHADKFKRAGITPSGCRKISTPFIKESAGHIECKLKTKADYGGVFLFVGKVVHCEIENRFYDGHLLPEKAKTPHHLGGSYFFVSGKRKKY